VIGRDDRADLVLDHDAVSRRHTYLQVIDGRVFFVDLDSRTGTAVEGASAAESGWVEPGQAVTIGPFTVRPVLTLAGGWPWARPEPDPARPFAPGEPVPNPLLARSSKTPAGNLPRVSLEFQSRAAGHSVWRMNPVMALVGRSARCKVRLLDSNVSNFHCA